MRKLVLAIAALVVGIPAGWFALSFFCDLSWIKFSVVCGHNAYVLLAVFIPASVMLVWAILRKMFATNT
jgi:hypothetical protein